MKKRKSKNKELTFADKAKKIKDKYKTRIDDGDHYAVKSMERELNTLFEEQETIKREKQRKSLLKELKNNPEILDNFIQESPQEMKYGGKMKYQDGGIDLNAILGNTFHDNLYSTQRPMGAMRKQDPTITMDSISAYEGLGTNKTLSPESSGNYAEVFSGNQEEIGKDSVTLDALDYASYAGGMGSNIAQMLNTSKPEEQNLYLAPTVDNLPQYYDQHLRNQIRSTGSSVRRGLADSYNTGNLRTNLVATGKSEMDAISELGQKEAEFNLGNEVNRRFTNAQIGDRNIDRMYRRDADYLADRARYEDLINTYIGSMGQNIMGISGDIQNRRAVQRTSPNIGVGGRTKTKRN